MRRINLLTGIFGCLFLILSCTPKKSEAPVVHFINPNVNTVHNLNTDLNIEVDIVDDYMIKEYKFWLESSSGWEYFSEKKKVNKDSHKILYQFDLSESINVDFFIHVEAVDNDDNRTHEQISVTIQ